MPPPNPVEAKAKFFSVDDANRALPLVKAIVGDIVRQFGLVNDLKQRLSTVQGNAGRPRATPTPRRPPRARRSWNPRSRSSAAFIEELSKLGVELKGPDGLCDFPSLREGREVYLCWKLGEDKVDHWHEKNAGFAGRQPLDRPAKPGLRPL